MNEAADKFFVGNAQVLRKLEAMERSLSQNAKIVVPGDSQLVNVIGDLAGITPVTVGDTAAPRAGAGPSSGPAAPNR